MTRREQVLNKLQAIPHDEVEASLRQLTLHVQARLRFRSKMDRTRSGAHSEKNLGMRAIDFYVGESVKRLWDPNGWDWKFEQRTLAEQLIRIANKLMSDKVKEYKSKLEDVPKFDDRDAGDIYDLENIAMANIKGDESNYAKLIQIATEQSQDDDNLQYFTLRYFEGASFETIAKEMNLAVTQIYVLRKKLVRRLTNYKEELTA